MKMKNLSNLEHRVAMLERPQNMSGIDLLVLAMETLDDTELGILQEYMSLLNAGFSLDEVSDMMGTESYSQALSIVNKIDQELERLTAPAQPKQTKKRRKRQQACDFDLESED